MAGAERPRHSALALPGAALAFGALLVVVAGERILPAYLGAFVFWTGVSTGALALLLVHRLTGGAWGGPVEPVLLGALRALPVMAALAVPLLVAAPRLYPWAGAEADAFAAHWYLLPWFFVLRAVIYFVVWLALAHALHAAAAGRSRPPRRLAAGGL
ncbi:MAG TPA: hypothetical protein VLW45_10380, partial [Pelomicrobium sp.]|nr:hypothetical protein [Pelomicrobium sp.]